MNDVTPNHSQGPEPSDPGIASDRVSERASDRDRLRALRRRARMAAGRKSRQMWRISRTTLRYAVFMCGAGGVCAGTASPNQVAAWKLG